MSSSPPISRTKPPALRPGDTIGIIAPASNIKREWLDAGCAALQNLGYKTFYFQSILEQDLYFAGSVDRRLRELEEMFVRDEIRAIVCARGGYGANYLLDRIDLRTVIDHPKIFVGYSDITTLLTYFADATGLITFHGPMATKDFAVTDGVDLAAWEDAISGALSWGLDLGPDSGVKSLSEGSAEGILYGGCLSMLVESLGTPYQIHTDDTILFIEDIAAKPYQIDRMLMHLKLAGKLSHVRGLVFGEMLDCLQHKDQPYTLEQVIMRIVGDLGIPVAYGLRSGHVSRRNITLPIGVRARLAVNAKEVSLKILESATSAVASRSMKV
jgi:muramoyltetrapeptide carboxypeptidase